MSDANSGDGMVTVTNIPKPHVTADAEPPDDNAPVAEWDDYRQRLKAYLLEWCNLQSETTNGLSEATWSDFTCDFSEKGITNLDRSEALRIRNFLLQRGVNVLCKRGYSRTQALL